MKPLEGKHILGFIYGTELFGSERGNLAALQSMQRSGARITVGISSRVESGGEVGATARAMGFETLEVPFGGPLSGYSMRAYKSYRKRQFKRLYTISRDLLPALRDMNPSHILIGSPLAHIYLAIALLRLGKPIIYRMGDSPEVSSKVQPHLWRLLALRANKIVANSHYVRSLVKEQGKRFDKKCAVIHNAAPARIEPIDKKKLDELIVSKNPFQLVYVGQLTERKGFHELIDALVKLDDSDIGCWFIGNPAGEQELFDRIQVKLKEAVSRTHIEFFGFQPDPRPYFMAADWHIAPSIYEEPFANVTIEAKSCATPSMVSLRGGFPEAIENGINGLLLEPLADKIVATIDHARTLDTNEMGKAAASSVKTTFSNEHFDSSWVNVIQQAK